MPDKRIAGYIVFQVCEIGRYFLCLSYYHFKRAIRLSCRISQGSLEAHMVLVGQASYKMLGFSKKMALAGTVNVLYYTMVHNTVDFLQGDFFTGDVHLPASELNLFVGDTPFVKAFMRKVASGDSASLYENNVIGNIALFEKMYYLIEEIENPSENMDRRIKKTQEYLKMFFEARETSVRQMTNWQYFEFVLTMPDTIRTGNFKFEAIEAKAKALGLNMKKIYSNCKLIFDMSPKDLTSSVRFEALYSFIRRGDNNDTIKYLMGVERIDALNRFTNRHVGKSIEELRREIVQGYIRQINRL